MRYVALFLVACSSSSSGGGVTATDSGAETAAPEDDGGTTAESGADGAVADAPADATHDAGAACNTLVNVGAPVPGNFVPSGPPAATGGALVSATYVLTKYQL